MGPSPSYHDIFQYLFHNSLVVSTHLKNISQNGNLPQIGVKIKNIWNHQQDKRWRQMYFVTQWWGGGFGSKVRYFPWSGWLLLPFRCGEYMMHMAKFEGTYLMFNVKETMDQYGDTKRTRKSKNLIGHEKLMGNLQKNKDKQTYRVTMMISFL